MADIVIRFDMRFGARVVRCLLAAGMVLTAVPELESETVTLSTYYPAPSGVYTQMITTGNTFLDRDPGGSVMIATVGGNVANKLSVNGSAAVGTYAGAGTAAPANGLIVSGAVGIGNSVPGAFALNVTGNQNVTGNMTITGNEQVNGAANITGNTTVGGTLAVNGAGGANVTNILTVGTAGNNRYIKVMNGAPCGTFSVVNGPVCGAGNYAAFTQGLLLMGWSYHDRGGQVIAKELAGGGTSTQVWALDTVTGVQQWMTLNKDDSAVVYYCCPL